MGDQSDRGVQRRRVRDRLALAQRQWGSIARNRDLLRPEVSEKEISAIVLATTPNIGFYVGVIVLAIIAPYVAAFGYLLIAIVSVLRARGDEAAPAHGG